MIDPERRRVVFLGYRCNNHCVFCSQGERQASAAAGLEPGESFSREKEIAFVGGEPTLSEGLLDAVSEAKKAGVDWVLVQTNARRLCYPDYARALAQAGVDALDVSLQGSTAAMHDYHTEVPGSWTQTVAGLRQARAAGMAVGVSTTVTRSNFRHLTDIVRLAHQLGARAIHFDLAKAYGRAAAARDRVIPAVELATEELIPAGREAVRLGLGLCVFGKASSPAARRLFAGLGDRNEVPAPAPAPAAAPAPASPQPAEAGARSRPNPGLRERRAQEKLTGEALRAIFPGLFEAAPTETSHG